MKRETGYYIEKDNNCIRIHSLREQGFNEQDKKDLWTRDNVLYLDGVIAVWVEERKEYNPLIHTMIEDDGTLIWRRETNNFCFDSFWIDNYIETLSELKKRLIEKK